MTVVQLFSNWLPYALKARKCQFIFLRQKKKKKKKKKKRKKVCTMHSCLPACLLGSIHVHILLTLYSTELFGNIYAHIILPLCFTESIFHHVYVPQHLCSAMTLLHPAMFHCICLYGPVATAHQFKYKQSPTQILTLNPSLTSTPKTISLTKWYNMIK